MNISPYIFFNQNSHNFGRDINLFSNLLVQNKFMFLIKLEGITHTTALKQIFCWKTHPLPHGMGSKRPNIFFIFESSHAAYKKCIEHRAPWKHIIYRYTHTTSTPEVGQSAKYFSFLKVVMFRIKLKGMEYRASCLQIFSLFTHLLPLGDIKSMNLPCLTWFCQAIHTHYYNSSWRTVSRRVDEVVPSDHPRREASRVIRWNDLIHKM